jgi:hypothetical protein
MPGIRRHTVATEDRAAKFENYRKSLTKGGRVIDMALRDYNELLKRDYDNGVIDLTEYDRKKVRLTMAFGAVGLELGNEETKKIIMNKD